MIKVLLVEKDKTTLSGVRDQLAAYDDFQIACAESGGEGLAMAKKEMDYDLAIVDETLSDMSGLEFVEQLLRVSAMINSAVISSLSEDDFHEASEGLGVLAHLSGKPGEDEVADLVKNLRNIVRLTKP